jgi:hypothetical protein
MLPMMWSLAAAGYLPDDAPPELAAELRDRIAAVLADTGYGAAWSTFRYGEGLAVPVHTDDLAASACA